MENINKIDFRFDDLLFQTQRGKLTHEQLERGARFEQFEQVKKWQLKYGYKFNIYGNDHLINGKAHFHLDNKEESVSCKIDFEGNILEETGNKSLPSNVLKELKYFLSKEENQQLLIEKWNDKNPDLVI